MNIWKFESRKTRIILVVSIAWCFISYWFITGGLTHYLDPDFYYKMIGYGSYDWQWVRGDFIVFTSPVWLYWFVIPIIRSTYNWIKEGG
jgi:hypothetical protein